jgi:hypothetical protein
MKQNESDNVLVKYSTGLLFEVSSKLVPLCGCCDRYHKSTASNRDNNKTFELCVKHYGEKLKERHFDKLILTKFGGKTSWRGPAHFKGIGLRGIKETEL